MNDLLSALSQRVLVCDGAIGTTLHAAGHAFDGSLAALNESSPGVVSAIHESYIAAGADVIQTNTFGASRPRLAMHGLADNVREINLAGAKIARDASQAADHQVFVAGSVSPAVVRGQRSLVAPEERVLALQEQMDALHEGAVDLLILETFGFVEELVEAIEVASAFDLPIVAQATFAEDGLTLSGDTPEDVARTLSGLPVDVIGVNCTVGPRKLVPVVAALAEKGTAPLSVQPNAGQPQRLLSDQNFRFTVDPDYFASYVETFVEAGAVLLGGCCGTTPAVTRAVAERAAGLRPTRTRQYPATSRGARPSRSLERRETLAQRLGRGEFVIAAEVTAPTGGTADEALQVASRLRRRGVDLSVIPSAIGARAQISPLSLAIALHQRTNVEPILAVSTWEKSVMALQAEMLGAHALEIHNIVCETGGGPIVGDYPVRDGLWETDSVGLVTLLEGLNRGRDCNGLTLKARTSFLVGARCNLGREDLDAEIARALTKVRCGARVLVTHPIYEPEALRRLCDAVATESVAILATVRPVQSAEEAEYLFHEVPDVNLPRETLDALRSSGSSASDAGLGLAEQLLSAIRPMVSGVVVASERESHLDRLVDYAFTLGGRTD